MAVAGFTNNANIAYTSQKAEVIKDKSKQTKIQKQEQIAMKQITSMQFPEKTPEIPKNSLWQKIFSTLTSYQLN